MTPPPPPNDNLQAALDAKPDGHMVPTTRTIDPVETAFLNLMRVGDSVMPQLTGDNLDAFHKDMLRMGENVRSNPAWAADAATSLLRLFRGNPEMTAALKAMRHELSK